MNTIVKSEVRVLMIDDDKEDFQIIKQMVGDSVYNKYSLDWTPSFTEGLNWISKKMHDVYIIDYKLGAKTGLELIKRAIEQGCEAPMIILTGNSNVEIDKEALEAGASDYLVKDTLSAQLIERSVRYAIANANQRKEMNRLNAELEERVKNRTIILEDTLSELEKFQVELIKSKNAVAAAAQIAEEASKSKSQFLSSMSHEIRTPMNAILGFTKILLRTDLTVKQREYLEAIKTSGDILSVLVNDILDLAKVESGKMTFVHEPFHLSPCINGIIQLFDSELDNKTLRVDQDYDSSIPETLLGDQVRLHQIILNLLSNAIKFTPAGRITVRVRLVSEDKSKVKIEFAVIDTGIGIPEDKLRTIFEKFEQASHITSKVYGGTGLGLSIAKQFVERQGGVMTVKSKLGEGSTFSFTLEFEKTKERPKEKVELPISSVYSNQSIHVLVAEDESINQLLIKTLMGHFGFNIEMVENGRMAIEKLKANKYDIILMDMQMPEMDGLEATAYIREHISKTIPIIALTADVTTLDDEKCKAAGMNAYISKPIDEILLYNTILKYIGDPMYHANDVKQKNVQSPKQRHFNLDYLDELIAGNLKAKTEFINMYLEQIPKLIAKMKTSMNNLDWVELRMAAHSLIPSFSLMGINKEFEDMARKIESNALAHENMEETSELITKIDLVCRETCEELRQEGFSK